MKKILILGSILFAVSIGSTQDLSFGVRAGGNMTSFSDTEKQFYGILGGILLEYKFNKIWSFQSEFLYSQRGNETSYEIRDYPTGEGNPLINLDILEKNALHYLDLGLYVKYYFNKRVNISTGMVLGNVINAERTYEAVNIDTGEKYDLRENFKEISNTDFGIPFGIEYKFKSGLAIDLQYVFGMLSLYESGESTKNQTLSLSVAYYF